MNIYVVNVFFEEVWVSFGTCDLRKNRESCVIYAVMHNKSIPFSKIPPFFKLLFRNDKLTFVKEL